MIFNRIWNHPRFQIKHKHIIDFLFPVALFFVFALSALTTLLLAARIYQNTTEHSSLNYTSRTSLAYICEKLHQNDCESSIRLGSFDGCDAIIMEQRHENEVYYTYIYAYQQELKELFVKKDVQVSAPFGRTILKIEDFSIEQLSEDLIRISCSDQKGKKAAATICIKSDSN